MGRKAGTQEHRKEGRNAGT
jgi:hypothetical protein